MPKEILAGSTDQTIDVFIQNSSSTTGAGLTGLVFNSASLVCYYRKGATGSATALTLATQTVGGAHSDGGFVEIDATNMPGMYRLDLSDTIVATAGLTKIMLKGATNMAPCVIEIEVVAVNKYDATRFGLSALPNAAAAASGGLMILGSNNTAAITIGALTVGAISGTTLTFSGAVAFQSTFAVTTSSSFGALSCSTFTASGAVAFQSTFAVTTSTSLAALSCTTLTASGAVAFQSTLGITGATTFTGTVTATDASNQIGGCQLGNFAHLGTSFTLSGSTAGGVFRIVNAGGPGIAITATTRGISSAASAGYGFYASGTTAGGIYLGSTTNGDGVVFQSGGGTGDDVALDGDGVIAGYTAQTGDSYARLGAPAGASVSADVAAVKTDTGNLVTRITSTLFNGITSLAQWLGLIAGKQTPDSTALTEIKATGAGSGTYDATTDSLEANRDNIGTAGAGLTAADDATLAAIAALTIPTAAQNATAVLDKALSSHQTAGTAGKAIYDADLRGSRTVVRGTVTTGASTTSIPTSAFSPAGGVADQFKGRIVVFDNDTTTVALRGQATDITASSNSSTPTLTVSTLATTPASGDTFSVL